ncbi:MAG: hypothetical protein ACK41Y_15940, partial [Paracoccus hibiscisoli]
MTEEPPIKPVSSSQHPKRWRRNRGGKPFGKRPEPVQTNRTTSMAAHLKALFGLSERRACQIAGADRKMV